MNTCCQVEYVSSTNTTNNSIGGGNVRVYLIVEFPLIDMLLDGGDVVRT